MSRKRKPGRSAQSATFASPTGRNLPSEARTLIASVANDITVPIFSRLLQNADDTLLAQGGGKGLAIYDEIERDTHAGSMLEKRKNSVISRDWEVEPGGDQPLDKEAAEFVEECIEALPFDQICKDLLGATLKGFAVGEIVWERDQGWIKPVRIKAHDQRRFVFDRDWQLRLLTWTAMTEGELLPDRKFVIHRVGVRGNNPYGLGLGNSLFWPVLFKREGITFWLHFLEKFAGPTVIGKTPYGMLSEEQNRLLNTLTDIRTSSAVTVPIGTDVDFLEASRGGSVSYQDFLAYWDAQISIRVTGETLTSQVTADGGSRALGDVHQNQLDVLADSDGDLLTDTLRQTLCRWIVEYNFPGAAVPSIRRIRPANAKAAAETRKAKGEAAQAMDAAIQAVVAQAAKLEDDQIAREYIISFAVTDGLSDRVIDALVAARHDFATAPTAQDAGPVGNPALFSASAASALKKKR